VLSYESAKIIMIPTTEITENTALSAKSGVFAAAIFVVACVSIVFACIPFTPIRIKDK